MGRRPRAACNLQVHQRPHDLVGTAGVNVERTDHDGRAALPATRLGVGMKKRRLPAPWTAEKVEGGYRVKDDHGHWLAFVWRQGRPSGAQMPNYLTWDEARRRCQGDRQAPPSSFRTD